MLVLSCYKNIWKFNSVKKWLRIYIIVVIYMCISIKDSKYEKSGLNIFVINERSIIRIKIRC